MKARTHREFEMRLPTMLSAILAVGLLGSLAGCAKSQVDHALESDARGYWCSKCQAKFYTAQDVFADVCPECRSPEILEVVGMVCAEDQTMTLSPRGRGAIRCQRCGKASAAMALPREADLRNWGAQRKSKNDVSAGVAARPAHQPAN